MTKYLDVEEIHGAPVAVVARDEEVVDRNGKMQVWPGFKITYADGFNSYQRQLTDAETRLYLSEPLMMAAE